MYLMNLCKSYAPKPAVEGGGDQGDPGDPTVEGGGDKGDPGDPASSDNGGRWRRRPDSPTTRFSDDDEPSDPTRWRERWYYDNPSDPAMGPEPEPESVGDRAAGQAHESVRLPTRHRSFRFGALRHDASDGGTNKRRW